MACLDGKVHDYESKYVCSACGHIADRQPTKDKYSELLQLLINLKFDIKEIHQFLEDEIK